jgi:hypothetical protein
MVLLKECFGRQFSEVPNFETQQRIPGRPSANYLTTVENGYDIDNETKIKSEKEKYRIQRWRAINDKDSKNNKIWKVVPKWCTHYNINSSEQLEDLSNIFNDLIVGNNTITLPTEEYNKIQKITRKQQIKIRGLHTQIQDLKSRNSIIEVERQSFKQRLLSMKNDIADLELILKTYQNKIYDQKTTETEIKDFIEENQAYWMFGLEYIGIKREYCIRFEKEEKFFLDFMLRRQDDFWDFVECKGPNDNLFDKRTKNRYKANKNLSEAIGQVFKYFYVMDKMAGDERVIKPKAFIVIGNQKQDVSSERRIFSSYLNNTEIITYSELYERGHQLLEHIRKINN